MQFADTLFVTQTRELVTKLYFLGTSNNEMITMKTKKATTTREISLHVYFPEAISRSLVCFIDGTGLVHSWKVVYKTFADFAKLW